MTLRQRGRGGAGFYAYARDFYTRKLVFPGGKDAHGEEDSALGSPLCVYVNNALGPA